MFLVEKKSREEKKEDEAIPTLFSGLEKMKKYRKKDDSKIEEKALMFNLF